MSPAALQTHDEHDRARVTAQKPQRCPGVARDLARSERQRASSDVERQAQRCSLFDPRAFGVAREPHPPPAEAHAGGGRAGEQGQRDPGHVQPPQAERPGEQTQRRAEGSRAQRAVHSALTPATASATTAARSPSATAGASSRRCSSTEPASVWTSSGST